MKRQLSLDLLRGIAVLLVIVRHCDVSEPILATVKRGGWIGVDLFFVLSGFLVAGLLFKQHAKEGRIRAMNFLVRRGYKIYPAFWVFTAVTMATYGLLFRYVPWSKLLHELLFVQSYASERLWGHTWSLAVEEHFYILLPLLLVPLAKVNFKPLPRIVLATMVALLIAKCFNAMRPFTEQSHLFPTHLRIDGLFFGVLLSYWHHTWPAFNSFCKENRYVLLTAGCLGFVPAFLFEVNDTPWLYSAGLTVQILASGAVLMAMVCGNVAENMVTRSLAHVGKYSYSIYLWHNFVIVLLIPMLRLPNAAIAVYAAIAGSVCLGIILSEIIETPVLKFREWATA